MASGSSESASTVNSARPGHTRTESGLCVSGTSQGRHITLTLSAQNSRAEGSSRLRTSIA